MKLSYLFWAAAPSGRLTYGPTIRRETRFRIRMYLSSCFSLYSQRYVLIISFFLQRKKVKKKVKKSRIFAEKYEMLLISRFCRRNEETLLKRFYSFLFYLFFLFKQRKLREKDSERYQQRKSKGEFSNKAKRRQKKKSKERHA